MNAENIAYTASVWVLPILLAITLHEAAHGWVAWRLGDDTAYRMGRVTFNPFRHIDPFGTIILPAMLLLASGGRVMFGAAKPVPVNFNQLRKPRRDVILVAAAGPFANLLIGLVSAAGLQGLSLLSGDFRQWVAVNLVNMIWLNCLLCIFNLIPLPPLDGGRIAVGLLPGRLARGLASLERSGIFIILGVIFVLPWLGRELGVDLNVFHWLIGMPAQFLMGLMGQLVGIDLG
ncbi:MAG: site-2 protease family protein [Rhodospirillales bacterium]|nr:site-2 protease family protein [Rhodospirillales bacterium]